MTDREAVIEKDTAEIEKCKSLFRKSGIRVGEITVEDVWRLVERLDDEFSVCRNNPETYAQRFLRVSEVSLRPGDRGRIDRATFFAHGRHEEEHALIDFQRVRGLAIFRWDGSGAVMPTCRAFTAWFADLLHSRVEIAKEMADEAIENMSCASRQVASSYGDAIDGRMVV